MKKLNVFLRRTIKFLKPYNDVDDFIGNLDLEQAAKYGLSKGSLGVYIGELISLGYVKERTAEYTDGTSSIRLTLTSEAMSYEHEHRMAILAGIGRVLLQILIGASGGLVVFLLSQLI